MYRRAQQTGCRAHPRSRGEHCPTVTRCTDPPGSSPLTRGTRHAGDAQRAAPGLIPAHAGNTAHLGMYFSSVRAHPRSRGEHPSRPFVSSHTTGSSPLTRGTLVCACACRTCGGAHPRSRGEHVVSPAVRTPPPGSSPLTRGTHRVCWALSRSTRLIPAHAGNTVYSYMPNVSREGSSPLTRGTRR